MKTPIVLEKLDSQGYFIIAKIKAVNVNVNEKM